MIEVVLVGTGNVARFLFDSFLTLPAVHIKAVVGRNSEALSYFKERGAVSVTYETIPSADIFILAVKDEVIPEVAKKLNLSEGLLVHTSGSVSIRELPAEGRRGVLYPLQTFSGVMPSHVKDIPFCLEAESQEDYAMLESLVENMSTDIRHITSEQRKKLHLAAVFANNFTNHLYHVAYQLCKENGVSPTILGPLIKETCYKIGSQDPLDAQTGPARRGDVKTMKQHLALLNTAAYKDIYTAISASIEQTYGEQL